MHSDNLLDRFDDVVDEQWEVLRGRPGVDRLFYAASALGDWSLIWHIAGVAQGLGLGPTGFERAVRLSTCLGIESAVVNGPVKSLFRRRRPIHDTGRPHHLRTPRTSSFPSGHASSAFMAAVLLSEGSRLAPLYFSAAAVVATSRVHVRIHHGSDVVAGAALGLALGALARRLWPA